MVAIDEVFPERHFQRGKKTVATSEAWDRTAIEAMAIELCSIVLSSVRCPPLAGNGLAGFGMLTREAGFR
jgi:hypothetical protein